MIKIIKRIFSSGEEEVFRELVKHIELSINALSNVEVVLDLRSANDKSIVINDLIRGIDTYEKMGDNIILELSRNLARGAVPVALTASLELLMDKIDDILDLIYYMGMELGRGYKAGFTASEVIKDIYLDVLNMVKVISKGLETLKELFSIALYDISKVHQLNSLVDVYEDRVDEMKNNTLNKVYTLGDRLNAIMFYHLTELIRTADNIIDTCKDASHAVLNIISSLLY